jgi:iron complex transport system substrate-binding protein
MFQFCINNYARLPMAILAALLVSVNVNAAERVVSMNLCVDKLLLRLLPLDQIAGLSYLSQNPDYSGYHEAIPKRKTHRGQVEELVQLQPDVIIAGEFGATEAVATLRHLGLTVETVSLPRTLQQSQEFILTIGKLIGAEAKARAYWQKQESQIKVAQQRVLEQGTTRTLLYSPNGMAIGKGTLEDTILTHIGLTNAAEEMGIEGWRIVSLEDLLVLQADRILLTGTSRHFSLAQEILSHPVLKQRVSAEVMPEGLSVCPAIHAGELALAMTR